MFKVTYKHGKSKKGGRWNTLDETLDYAHELEEDLKNTEIKVYSENRLMFEY